MAKLVRELRLSTELLRQVFVIDSPRDYVSEVDCARATLCALDRVEAADKLLGLTEATHV